MCDGKELSGALFGWDTYTKSSNNFGT